MSDLPLGQRSLLQDALGLAWASDQEAGVHIVAVVVVEGEAEEEAGPSVCRWLSSGTGAQRSLGSNDQP